MANELSIGLTLSYSKGGRTLQVSESFQRTVSGNAYVKATQSISTSAGQTLDLGPVGTVGFVLLKNTDDTNYVDFGYADSPYVTRLLPGESCLLPWSGAAIYAKAHTAACIVEYTLIEA